MWPGIAGGSLNLIRKYWVLFFIAGIVIGLDQWTKSMVRTLPVGEIWLPSGLVWLSPYARIIHWYNTGAAFGSFQGFGWVFTILAFLVVGLIIYYFPQVDARDWWLKVAMGLQMGGALGNVVDRLTNKGQVTDFISVGNFAVFNLADASISVGVVILLAGAWFKEKGDRKKAAVDLAPAPQDVTDLPPASETGVNQGESSGE
jgi:signal peptidase II